MSRYILLSSRYVSNIEFVLNRAMSNKKGKTHCCTCIYKNCGINSRNNILNVRFFRLPVEDRERLITWLVNSGRDNLAEESDEELRKLRMCSRHFSTNMMYPSGRLRKGAEPLIYPIVSDEPDSINPDNTQCQEHNAQIRILENKLARKNDLITTLRNRIDVLRRMVRAQNAAIVRLRTKVTNNLSNTNSKKMPT